MSRSGVLKAVIVADNGLEYDARVLKEAEALQGAGFDVTCLGIITAAGQPEMEETGFGRIIRVNSRRGPQIRSESDDPPVSPPDSAVPSKQSAYDGHIGILRHWVGRMRVSMLLYRVARDMSPDVAICCDLPTLPTAVLLGKRAGCATIYDVHDLYTRQGRSTSRLFRMLYGLTERLMIRAVDAVITVSPQLSSDLAARYRISEPTVIYNGPSECTAKVNPIHEPLRLLFQGAYLRNRNLVDLVRAMDRLRGRAILSLQGWGEMEPELRELVDTLELDETVRFLDRCKPMEVVECAREHDVGVICYRGETSNLEMAVPNKLMDYLGAGLAVAVSDLPGLRGVVQEAGFGVLIDPATPESIAAGLLAMIENSAAIVQMRDAAVRSCARYSWDRQAENLIEIVNELAGGRTITAEGNE